MAKNIPQDLKNVQFEIPSLEIIEQELDRRHSANSFAEFCKRAWHVLEPSTPLKWGWCLDAMTEHLEAVHTGEIKRLLMNVPPGTMKSLLTGVMFPAWEWTFPEYRSKRFISTAHKQELATRDNQKCRRLITSKWYTDRWNVELASDQQQKTKFENVNTGFRESMAFTSMTGSRGDRIILDDPLSADDANSDAALYAAEITFTETLPTRVNNENSAIIVVMQRLSERDTSGIILERDLGYTHLMLPMRYEPERKCYTSIGFKDPREVDGELLFPERFNETQVQELEKVMGSYASAGQLAQRPSPRGGGLFQRDWLKPLAAEPFDIVATVRGYDLAASEKATADYTASVKIGKTRDNKIVILDVWRDQISPQKVRTRMLQSASGDGIKTRISSPQDPGAAGKGMVEQYRQDMIGYDIRFSPETGSKVQRALPLAAQAEAGAVYYVVGEWNREFLDELATFPMAKHDDMVDAASRAFNELLKLSKTIGGSVSVAAPLLIS